MDFHRMRCFLAVADLLHFSRAAERVHLSQPALSTQVRRLEDELGAVLFERSHQKTTLTYAGLVYSTEAREILSRLERAVERARLAAQGRIGRVRVGFISTAAAYLIPSLVAEFRKSHPDVDLELGHHLTAQQVKMLLNGTLDVGFFRIPITDQPRLRIIPIHKEPFKLFVPVNHPLASRSNIDIPDLDGFPFVIYARRNAPGFHDFVSGILKASNVKPSMTYEASDMYTLVSLVSAGVGAAIAPASLLNYRLPDITVRDIAGVPPSEIAVAYMQDNEHPAARAFLQLTCERMGAPDFAGAATP